MPRTKPAKRKSNSRVKTKQEPISCLAIMSDTHCGCRMALCPPCGIPLADGGEYFPSPFQVKLWSWWEEFWAWVDGIVGNRPLGIIAGGDLIDGVHHRSVTQISQNQKDQQTIAKIVFAPIRERCKKMWATIGTEAHVGLSGMFEQFLAETLHCEALPGISGEHNRARWELNLEFGPEHMWRINEMHHVSPTSNPQFTPTALGKELYLLRSQKHEWGRLAPHIIARHHRHTFVETSMPSADGLLTGFATPCWQMKTPYCYRTPARIWESQCGGALITSDENGYRVHNFVRSVEQSVWEKA